MQYWLWLGMFASFAVKVPMWPVHTWLPDAHVDAPTAGSVILAGVLLKMGGYGFLRFSLPMLPEASAYFTPFVFTLSIIAIVYTSLVALVQGDMKKLKTVLFVIALSAPAAAEEPSRSNPTVGWLVVAGSIIAGAAITTYGLTIDCAEDDSDCHRRAALPIWGGVGVASTGSLVGLCIVQSHAGPSGTAVSLNLEF